MCHIADPELDLERELRRQLPYRLPGLGGFLFPSIETQLESDRVLTEIEQESDPARHTVELLAAADNRGELEVRRRLESSLSEKQSTNGR